MKKDNITNKITPCCTLPFENIYWWVSNVTLASESNREFIISKLSQCGTIGIDGWKVLINSGTLESDSPLTKVEFLKWFDCGRQPSCEQLKVIIESYKIGNYDPTDEFGVGWTELNSYEEFEGKIIKKITGYVGGIGDMPTELTERIGKYYKVDGGLTLIKTEASDFKPEVEVSDGYNAREIENIINTTKIRETNHGVISFFPDITKRDYFGNNKFSKVGPNYFGDFKVFDSKYIWSFGFTVQMPSAKFTGNLCTVKYGSYTFTIQVGGIGIAIPGNGIAYDYEGKLLNVVIIADGYFIRVVVDGKPMGALNIGKKMTSFEVTLNEDHSQVVKSAAFWNRKISYDRCAKWKVDRPFVMPSPEDKLFPQEGYQVSNKLLVGNEFGLRVPGEQNVIKFNDKFHLYYTASEGDANVFVEGGIALAVSSRVDGGYSMYSNDVVIGGSRNKAGVTRAMSSWAGVKDGSVYVFAAADYTVNSAGGYIFKSVDGKIFTKVGDLPTSIPRMANMGFWPEKQADGYFYGLVEGHPGAIWEIYLVRSLNWENGWEMVQLLTTLQYSAGGMYGGPKLMRSSNNDRWIVVYHAATDIPGQAPTSLIVAQCKDAVPINWTNKKLMLDITDALEYYNAYNCDQAATPHIIEESGKTYLSFVLAQNSPDLFCQIKFAQFDGNKEELFGIVNMNDDVIRYDNTPAFSKIIGSGTSITNGIGSDNAVGINEAKTWRSILQSNITRNSKSITVVNGGVNGQNTTSMRANLTALISGSTGEVVIIEGAINDAQTAGVGIPTATTIDNLNAMVNAVVSSGNIPVLTTPLPIDFTIAGIASAYTVQKRIDLVNAVKKVAMEKNVKLVDFDKYFNNDVTLLVDGLHPNARGYSLMAYYLTRDILK